MTSSAVGLPLGPIVGGWLLDDFSSGSVFVINVPLVAVGLLALTVYLPETRSERPRLLDGQGILLSSVGLVALIYGLIDAGRAVAAAVESERDAALARLKLLASVPALRARQGAEGRKTFDFYTRLFAARSGRPVDDYQLRVTTAAFTAAQLEAARYWADGGGSESLARLMDDAVTLVEPLIASL